MTREELILQLNAEKQKHRLKALKSLKKLELKDASLKPAVRHDDANNHIHTFYSFSPYSPSKAAYMAYRSGLETMGIMDHDSLSGAKEFIEACKILGTNSTIGFEFRAHVPEKYKKGRNINNPDQKDHIYVALHGIAHGKVKELNNYLENFRIKRNIRNLAMTERINEYFKGDIAPISFEKDVLPLSKYKEGGSVTERHLMLALAKKLIEKFGKGKALIEYIKDKLGLSLSEKAEKLLLDENNPFYEYDLLGLLKTDVRFFYIDACDESSEVEEIIKAAHRAGAIAAYPYLGDIEQSVTGDKRAQKLEDDFLDEWIKELKEMGFDAIAYMPTRNTDAQLLRLQKLCKEYGFFEISGEDINSPRQRFECDALKKPEYSHLIESTWALIGHEKMATVALEDGMFSEKAKASFPNLDDRIRLYTEIGKKID